jgi:hypothetical protein
MGTDTKNVIDDSQRAQSLGVRSFDISKLQFTFAAAQQLMETVNLYKSRTFDEEISFIQSEFGSKGFISRAKTSTPSFRSSKSIPTLD